MYYDDLKDILNNEIIYCIATLCKKKKKKNRIEKKDRIKSAYANY